MPFRPRSGTARVAIGWPARLPSCRLACGGLLLWACCGILPGASHAARPAMHGPPQDLVRRAPSVEADPARTGRSVWLAPIRFFQRHISPIDGPRCQFSPTCSGFGYQAIHAHGFWIGGMMTADRLLRCSPLTAAEQYHRLPNGRLVDPVADNRWED